MWLRDTCSRWKKSTLLHSCYNWYNRIRSLRKKVLHLLAEWQSVREGEKIHVKKCERTWLQLQLSTAGQVWETVIGVRDVLLANGCPHQQAAEEPDLLKICPLCRKARGADPSESATSQQANVCHHYWATVKEPQECVCVCVCVCACVSVCVCVCVVCVWEWE